MDLSFPRFVSDAELTLLPADLAMLMLDVAARQAASTTAQAQAGFASGPVLAPVDPRLFAPLDGAFNGPVARALIHWKKE